MFIKQLGLSLNLKKVICFKKSDKDGKIAIVFMTEAGDLMGMFQSVENRDKVFDKICACISDDKSFLDVDKFLEP